MVITETMNTMQLGMTKTGRTKSLNEKMQFMKSGGRSLYIMKMTGKNNYINDLTLMKASLYLSGVVITITIVEPKSSLLRKGIKNHCFMITILE